MRPKNTATTNAIFNLFCMTAPHQRSLFSQKLLSALQNLSLIKSKLRSKASPSAGRVEIVCDYHSSRKGNSPGNRATSLAGLYVHRIRQDASHTKNRNFDVQPEFFETRDMS